MNGRSHTAFVLSEKASSQPGDVNIVLWNRDVHKTGTAPYCIIGVTVVGKPQATVITSSPFFILLSPNLGKSVYRMPIGWHWNQLVKRTMFYPSHFARRVSNLWAQGPAVSQEIE